MQLAELLHVVDFHMATLTDPADRLQFISALSAGWPDGMFSDRPAAILANICCLDCTSQYPNCPTNCETYLFRGGPT
jgi:hypothetical protein